MDELKLCPFCGGNAKLEYYKVSYSSFNYDGMACRVNCEEYGATSPYKWGTMHGSFKTDERELAVEAWNTRADNT